MSTDVQEFIAKCIVCQKCRSPQSKTLTAPLQPLPIPDRPNERVHADLIGPLKTSENGNKMVLVLTDAFTKYAVCVPIPNKEAKTVAQAIFTRYLAYFSFPKTLLL